MTFFIASLMLILAPTAQAAERPKNHLNPAEWMEEFRAPPSEVPLTEAEEWDQAGFKLPLVEHWTARDFYRDKAEHRGFTHAIRITAVMFRDAGWERDEIRARMARMAAYITQCGMRLDEVTFVASEAPRGWVDVEREIENSESKIAFMTPARHRPVFYYVRSHREAQMRGVYGTAWTERIKGIWIHDSLLNTVWLTKWLKKAEEVWYTPEVSIEVHELGHLLTNDGHRPGKKKNFLAEYANYLNERIEPDQCRRMRKHRLVEAIARISE